MPRQEIKEQLSALEEQLDLLSARSRSGHDQARLNGATLNETIDALKGLHELIHDQSLRKSLSAQDFLRRVVSVLVQDASALGYNVAVSCYGEGRISAEMVEISMGAIVACLKASLRSYRNMAQAIRMQNHLFPTYGIYLEVKANPDGIQFRLIDDGKGYSGGFLVEAESETQFDRLRTQVAKQGGWFTRRSFGKYGGTIEFKVLLPRARFESLVLKTGETEILLPCSYVSEVCEITDLAEQVTEEDRIFVRMDPHDGFSRVEEPTGFATAVRVAVADFQFWVLCDEATQKLSARRYPAGDFVEEGCWFNSLGLCPTGGSLRALPLVEGEQLMKFYSGWRKTHAGV